MAKVINQETVDAAAKKAHDVGHKAATKKALTAIKESPAPEDKAHAKIVKGVLAAIVARIKAVDAA